MRLEAQKKLGYYSAAPEAIGGLLKHLRPSASNRPTSLEGIILIDPCAGEGEAIDLIRSGLDVDPGRTYAVELDKGRSAKVRERIPGARVIGPASFLGCQVTGHSFGLAYVNPPFDHELGGGRREEQAFAEHATRLLVTRGVLALVSPLRALVGNRGFVRFLDAWFEDSALYKFPDGTREDGRTPIRPYNEIVFLGAKRKYQLSTEDAEAHGILHRMRAQWSGYVEIGNLTPLGARLPRGYVDGRPTIELEERVRKWLIPVAREPQTFRKTAFTDDELAEAVDSSPLGKILDEVLVPPPARPPLPLDKGHLGLILASGMLDGVVEGPHGVHVVRGSSHKVEYHNKEASRSEENPETGAVTTKDVFSERMVTVIRCVEQDGVIYTHSNDAIAEERDDEVEPTDAGAA